MSSGSRRNYPASYYETITKDLSRALTHASTQNMSEESYDARDSPLRAISKSLGYHLRHNKDITLTSEGFVKLEKIWPLLPRWAATSNNIALAVVHNPKQRYELKFLNQMWMIRATQGHSIREDIEESMLMEPVDRQRGNLALAGVAVHGTSLQSWEKIKDQGLRRMARTHVHWATTAPSEGNAIISGLRSNSEVLVFLDVPNYIDSGGPAHATKNHVLCTGEVLPHQFHRVYNCVRRQWILRPLYEWLDQHGPGPFPSIRVSGGSRASTDPPSRQAPVFTQTVVPYMQPSSTAPPSAPPSADRSTPTLTTAVVPVQAVFSSSLTALAAAEKPVELGVIVPVLAIPAVTEDPETIMVNYDYFEHDMPAPASARTALLAIADASENDVQSVASSEENNDNWKRLRGSTEEEEDEVISPATAVVEEKDMVENPNMEFEFHRQGLDDIVVPKQPPSLPVPIAIKRKRDLEGTTAKARPMERDRASGYNVLGQPPVCKPRDECSMPVSDPIERSITWNQASEEVWLKYKDSTLLGRLNQAGTIS